MQIQVGACRHPANQMIYGERFPAQSNNEEQGIYLPRPSVFFDESPEWVTCEITIILVGINTDKKIVHRYMMIEVVFIFHGIHDFIKQKYGYGSRDLAKVDRDYQQTGTNSDFFPCLLSSSLLLSIKARQ